MRSMGGAAKCDACGKFRRWEDVVCFDAGDSYVIEMAVECKTCTAPANLREAA